jgi:hypothetical protein
VTIYLYIKKHNKTGLQYFGKTIANPFTYCGSGKYWTRHLKTHGRDISTIEVWGFDNDALAEEFALTFSKTHDIVGSDVWANLVPENGRGGTPGLPPANKGKPNSSEQNHHNREWHLGRKQSHSQIMKKARTYSFLKDGKVITFTNMRQFCRDNKLDAPAMRRVIKGEWSHHHGYQKT